MATKPKETGQPETEGNQPSTALGAGSDPPRSDPPTQTGAAEPEDGEDESQLSEPEIVVQIRTIRIDDMVTTGEAFDLGYGRQEDGEEEAEAALAPTRKMRTISEARAAVNYLPNQAGVAFNPDTDNCFHLNASYRNGTCIVQGNAPCPFLGGNCGDCDLYTDRASEHERREGLPPQEKYANG